MKKIVVDLVLVVCFTVNIYSQSGFEYLHKGNTDHFPGNMIESPTGSLIITVVDQIHGHLIKLDNSTGEIIDSVKLNVPDGYGNIFEIIQMDDSSCLGLGGCMVNDTSKIWLIQFDNNLNIINQVFIKVRGEVCPMYINTLKTSNDNIVIGFSYYKTPGLPYTEIAILEIDTSFQVINSRYFETSNTTYYLIFDIIKSRKYSYDIFTSYYLNCEKVTGFIFSLNKNFDIMESQVLPWEHFYDLNTVKQMNKSNIIVTGKKISLSDNEYQLGIMKMDSNFNLINTNILGKEPDTIDFPGISKNMDFKNPDNIFYAGFSNVYLNDAYFSPFPTWLCLNKLDRELNLKWQKYYGGDACYILWSMLATNDGGCVMAAHRYDHEYQDRERDVYILKVDQNGEINFINDEIKLKTEVLVYPNPGSDKMFVSINPNLQKAVVEVYTVDGKLIKQKQLNSNISEINTDMWQSGQYFYRIIKDGKLLNTGHWLKL